MHEAALGELLYASLLHPETVGHLEIIAIAVNEDILATTLRN